MANAQVHESPAGWNRNRLLVTYAVFPLVLYLATANLSATLECVALVVLAVLPQWLWRGRFTKSIQITCEGLHLKRYNNTTVGIPWTDLVRVKIRPFRTLSGFRYVDIYSRTAGPVAFPNCISGYDDLMAEIRRHLNGDVEDAEEEWLASAKDLPAWKRRVLRLVVVAALFLAFGSMMVFPEVLSRPSTAILALSLSVSVLSFICIAVLYRMTFAPAALRAPVRKVITVCTACSAIVFTIVAVQTRNSDLRLASSSLVAVAICCVTGALAHRMLNDR